jgi:hypothetical protein
MGLMPFTDDDLKRLKEDMSRPFWAISQDNVKALLARLEAAEAMIEYTHDDEDCPKTFTAIPEKDRKPCQCGLDEKYEAWRKACGK